MKRLILSAALVLTAANAIPGHHEKDEAAAEEYSEAAVMEAMAMAATPGEAHAKLAEAVGEYTADMAFYMGPGGEAMKTTMTLERRMDLQGRVLVEDWEGIAMGQPFVGHGRTGYDNVTKRYWSTWTDNMSTGVLVMHGEWDEAEQAIVYTGESVNPMTGQPYKMRSVATFPESGKEVMTMYEDHGEGEYKSMTMSLTKL